jgi:hypothetical protein
MDARGRRGSSARGGSPKERTADALRALEGIGAIERRYNLYSSVAVAPGTKGEGARDPDAPELAPAAQRVLEALRRTGALTLSRKKASRTGSRTGFRTVALGGLAAEAGVTRPVCQGALLQLAHAGVVEMRPQGPPVADFVLKTDRLSPDQLRSLERTFGDRAASEAAHLDAVDDYTSATSCRRASLLSYFGDRTAAIVAPCDGCDVCRSEGRRHARRRHARRRHTTTGKPPSGPPSGRLGRWLKKYVFGDGPAAQERAA